MLPYQKFFVSQHFGKSLSSVELDATGGQVMLQLSVPAALTVTFSFSLARLGQFVHDPAMYAETATRIAVQQAHKLFSHKELSALNHGELPLALETSPWIGDLTDVPYGGATSGYESFAANNFAGAGAALAAVRPV